LVLRSIPQQKGYGLSHELTDIIFREESQPDSDPSSFKKKKASSNFHLKNNKKIENKVIPMYNSEINDNLVECICCE
jgi:hypothetical protein